MYISQTKNMEEGQQYARAVKMLGNCRLEVACFDGVTRLGKIRGAIRKKQWISIGDIVLVTTRDYQDKKCDVIAKLTPEELRELRRAHPSKFMTVSTHTDDATEAAAQTYAFETEEVDVDDI